MPALPCKQGPDVGISVDNFVKNLACRAVQHTQVYINSQKFVRLFLKYSTKSMAYDGLTVAFAPHASKAASGLACGVLGMNRSGFAA
jgi:hypothetical protein